MLFYPNPIFQPPPLHLQSQSYELQPFCYKDIQFEIEAFHYILGPLASFQASPMPGTIKVSVLDFMGLQSSSAPLQVSVKVSMGKREYNTSDKGEFSFPLTTLRDNLVVALQDAEGNEISNTGIETRLVIEKGVWDDIFPLKGGGHVHMRLQFLLSEDDRLRIRNMRESALLKKHEEIPDSELESPQHNSNAGSNVSLPSKSSSEASESQKLLLRDELVTAQAGIASMSCITLTNKGKVDPEDIEPSRSDQMQTNTGRQGDAEALSQSVHVLSKEVSPMCAVYKTETVGSLLDVPFSEETSSSGIIGSVASPESGVSEKPNDDRPNDPNKQSSLNKTPSNVRKMITAFETSLNQDMRPQRRPTSTRSQSTKPLIEADLNSSQLNEVRTKKNIPVRSLSGEFRSLLHTDADMQNGTAHIQDNEEHSDFVRTLNAKSSQYTEKSELRAEHLLNREQYAYFKNNFIAKDHEVGTEKKKMYAEKMVRVSTSEKASASGRTLNECIGVFSNLSSRKGQSSNLLVNKSATGTHMKGSQKYLNIQGASGDNNYLLERSGAWIFPDRGGKQLCLTAGGKKIMNLMGDLYTDEESQTQKMNFSGAESMKKCNVPGATRLEPKENEEIPQTPQKTNSRNSTDSETSIGPLGQVMKVAIMVGFATLVLFTRQRNTDR